MFESDIGWLLFAYVVGTLFGLYTRLKPDVKTIAESVIDSLIADGYLKTTGTGKDMKILKHTEWNND